MNLRKYIFGGIIIGLIAFTGPLHAMNEEDKTVLENNTGLRNALVCGEISSEGGELPPLENQEIRIREKTYKETLVQLKSWGFKYPEDFFLFAEEYAQQGDESAMIEVLKEGRDSDYVGISGRLRIVSVNWGFYADQSCRSTEGPRRSTEGRRKYYMSKLEERAKAGSVIAQKGLAEVLFLFVQEERPPLEETKDNRKSLRRFKTFYENEKKAIHYNQMMADQGNKKALEKLHILLKHQEERRKLWLH